MSSLCALALLAALASIGLLWEAQRHRKILARIPIRIHVNGTRGKSSVTRLIAAGLRGGGMRVCAKTTGTLARMIFPSGKELPIFRPGRANVIEQKRIVRAAAESKADCLVIECMALQPLLQSTCELQLVRSTHGVITNARADHLDVMGPTRLDVAKALAGTCPVGGECFTAEQREDSLEVLRAATSDRRTRFHVINDHVTAEVTSDELAKFSYLEHAENVAIALRVCHSLGVSREQALAGMWAAQPDPGAMRVNKIRVARRSTWTFVNGFAANDPESTEQLWKLVGDRYPRVATRVLVMNCRADRPERSMTLGKAVGGWSSPDVLLVMGTGTAHFVQAATAGGMGPDRLVCLGQATGEAVANQIWQRIGQRRSSSDADWQSQRRAPGGVVIMGIGNVAGPGFEVAEFFASRSSWEPAGAPSRSEVPSAVLATAAPLTPMGVS